MIPTFDQIQRAAYHHWERSGRRHGQDRRDWFAAEQHLRFALNYELIAQDPLNGDRQQLLGRLGRRRCRFCERAAPRATFRGARSVLPKFLGTTSPRTFDVCEDCDALFEQSFGDDFERFSLPFRTGLAPGEASSISLLSLPYRPIAAFKCLTGIALAIMPEDDLSSFEDAIEWISNPDHAFDACLLPSLVCHLHFIPDPFPGPWTALTRRIHDDAPVPFMLFFLGTNRVVFQVAVPFCVRDEDLDGETAVLPPGPGFPLLEPKLDVIARAISDLSSAEIVHETELRFDPS